MHTNSGVLLRVGGRHDRGHRSAGAQAGDIHPGWVDRKVSHHLFGDAGNDARFAGSGPLILRTVPIPKPARVGSAGLLRVETRKLCCSANAFIAVPAAKSAAS